MRIVHLPDWVPLRITSFYISGRREGGNSRPSYTDCTPFAENVSLLHRGTEKFYLPDETCWTDVQNGSRFGRLDVIKYFICG